MTSLLKRLFQQGEMVSLQSPFMYFDQVSKEKSNKYWTVLQL